MENAGQEGRTVIFVSHNMSAITRLCRRVLLMHEGRIIEDGPSDEVVSSYLFSDAGASASFEWPEPETGTRRNLCQIKSG